MRSVLMTALFALGPFGLPLAGAAAPKHDAKADAAPATIHVTLPANARLTFDGAATKTTSADRTFVTPPLEKGKEFQYTLKAHFTQGDNAVTVERQIVVRAGQETDVSLNPQGASAGDRAFYFNPAAPTAPAQYRAFYYNPAAANVFDASVPFYIAPNLNVPRGGVAPARDNWKPDPTDPFYLSDGW